MTDKKKPEINSSEEMAINTERLEKIASDIEKQLSMKKQSVYEIGKLLCEAAKEYKYDGEIGFMKWHDENFADEFSYRTAHNYMRVYLVCPGPEVVQYLPLKLLYKICEATFPEQLRQFIFDHGKRFEAQIKLKELKAIADKVKKVGFDRNDPAVKKLLIERELKEELRDHIENMDRDLKELASLWNEFFSALTGMPRYRNTYMLTRGQKKLEIVGKLENWGLMHEYKIYDEETGEITDS
jgi:hypothetical protein